MFSDFNIDSKRIYTAGFSGGSRLASAIAVLTDQIQGVIHVVQVYRKIKAIYLIKTISLMLAL